MANKKLIEIDDPNYIVVDKREFVPIAGYERYEVNALGQVRHSTSKKIRKNQSSKSHPYPYCVIRQGKKRVKFYIHRLIMQHFVPNPYFYRFVDHKDGNKNNSVLDNLRWCTHGQNIEFAIENNLMPFIPKSSGENGLKVKLNWDIVDEIRNSEVIDVEAFANKYKVTVGTIQKIVNGESWKEKYRHNTL